MGPGHRTGTRRPPGAARAADETQSYAVDGFTVVNTYEARYAGQNRKWSGNAHLVHSRTHTHTHTHAH